MIFLLLIGDSGIVENMETVENQFCNKSSTNSIKSLRDTRNLSTQSEVELAV